jgi:hypothetical protein
VYKENNEMKKLLIAISLVVALSATASQHVVQSFLAPGVQSLLISTNGGTFPGVTNGTDYAGVMFTNSFGSRNYQTNSSTPYSSLHKRMNLLSDVELWPRADGAQPFTVVSNTVVQTPGIGALLSDFTLCVTSVGTNANAADIVTIIIKPMYDGVHVSTIAAEAFTTGFTANGTTTVNFTTNVPCWKWPGCAKLRLESISNAEATICGDVWIQSVTLNGFLP